MRNFNISQFPKADFGILWQYFADGTTSLGISPRGGNMKQILLAGVVLLTASSAFAGGVADPIVEPYVAPAMIADDAVASSGSDEWVLGLLVILTIGLGITGQ